MQPITTRHASGPALWVTTGNAPTASRSWCAGGDGLARDPTGGSCSSPARLPGETVDVPASSGQARPRRGPTSHGSSSRAPTGCVPPCPQVAAGCGGCGWQHISPDAPAPVSRLAIVREALARTGRLPDADVVLGAPLPSESVRTSVRMAVDPDGRLGFRAAAEPRRSCRPTHCLVTHRCSTRCCPAPGASGPTRSAFGCGVASGERTRVASRRRRHASRAGRRRGDRARTRWSTKSSPATASASAHRRSSSPRPQGAGRVGRRRSGAASGDLAQTARLAIDAYAGVGLFAATVFGPDVEVLAVESSAGGVRRRRRERPRCADRPIRPSSAGAAHREPTSSSPIPRGRARQGWGRLGARRPTPSG